MFKTYISHKKVKAKPMTRKEAEEKGLVRDKKPDSIEDENGYKVVYEDGYESWSPQEVFENGYKEKKNNCTFGEAIEKLKMGKKMARSGWNGKDMFIYYVSANKYPMSNNLMETMAGRYDDDMVPYQAYIAFKTVDDTVVPWLASQTDILSEDWIEIE